MTITNIDLQDELEQSVAQLAAKLKQSRNWVINEAVKEFLEQRSFEEQRWQETLPALASVKNGDSIAAAKVESWLAGEVLRSNPHHNNDDFLHTGSYSGSAAA